MKKTAITFIVLACIASSCKTTIPPTKQQKSIVGVWNFTKDHLVLEITETNIGEYGGDMSTEYKILNKKELLERNRDKENIRKYELQKEGNHLMLLEGKNHKHFGEKIKVQPNKNLVGRYVTDTSCKTDFTYIEIIDEINALAGRDTSEVVSLQYIELGQKLLLIHNGYYLVFEINDDVLLFKDNGIEIGFKKEKKELLAMYCLDEQGEILDNFNAKPITVCVETKGFVQGETLNLVVTFPFGKFAGGVDTLKFQAKVEKGGKAYQRNIILEVEENSLSEDTIETAIPNTSENTDTVNIDFEEKILTIKDRYKFQNFPTKIYDGALSPPDFTNNPYVEEEGYVEFITEGCEKTGINFGEHFTILEKSCGCCCSFIIMIDRKSGHIFTDIKVDGYDEEAGAYGYKYRKGSHLLIANSELFIDDKYEQYSNFMGLKPKFYIWIKNAKEFMLLDK